MKENNPCTSDAIFMAISVHFYLFYPISRPNSFDVVSIDNQHIIDTTHIAEMSDVEMDDNDIIFTGQVRRPQNRTSPRQHDLRT